MLGATRSVKSEQLFVQGEIFGIQRSRINDQMVQCF